MRVSRLIFRSLGYYWRTNLAVLAGIAIAVSVLAGALLVGQSVRASLRDLLFQRLGATEYVVTSDRFFRTDLARELVPGEGRKDSPESCALMVLQGVVIHEGTGTRAYDVNVYGIDSRFWAFHGASGRQAPEGRNAAVGEPLARKLGSQPGDGLLLRIETRQGIPKESVYGRRENAGRTVRLRCSEIVPTEQLGEFSLQPAQGTVYSMFVPLERLQRDLAQPGQANAILLAHLPAEAGLETIRAGLARVFTLQDAGIRVRPLPSQPGIAIESTRVFLDEPAARAAFGAAAGAGLPASGTFSYLANSIRAGGREIPYSVITAADIGQGAMTSIRGIENMGAGSASADPLWLNEWAWKDLGISPGDPVEVDYYLWQEEGRLVTRTTRFRFAGVIPIGGDVDTALAPDFPGISEARSIRSWDPPFPLDLRRIRPRDEEYWNRYRATPKAFIPLSAGQKLWGSRFGKLTSVRVAFPEGMDAHAARAGLEKSMRDRIRPEPAGFVVEDMKKRGRETAQGSTDFGEYFIYFSFFLIAAAMLLAALFFRLGVEQRVREIGTLQAAGFPMSRLRRIFLTEGAVLSIGGSLLGLLGAVGYGSFLMFGLRNWWIGAVGTNRLTLHLSWADLGLGAGAGIFVSLAMIAWTLHGLRRNSPRALLAGVIESGPTSRRRTRALGIVSSSTCLAAILLLFGSAAGRVPEVEGFFGSGFLLLIAILSLMAILLRRPPRHTIAGHGWKAFLRLGARNAMHRPGRSLLCISLLASATFIIVSVEAFRQDPHDVSLQPGSGTGGYALAASSAVPIVYDPNTDAGREALGIPAGEFPQLAPVRFASFRVRPGDDASCLNLYAPREPKVLGASHAFLARGRFAFQDAPAATDEEKKNPWLLLESASRDGAIPAIADANTIQYILHLSLGRELTVRGSEGTPIRLRLVAALRSSILQGALVISEANFLRAFPNQEGFRFFLMEAPPDQAAVLAQSLMERLSDWGFAVESTRERLAAYHEVENTYLSTFQSLGALGLVLGTLGLATVLLRNVLERRRELALLRAVGYRGGILSVIIVAENMMLMILGLVAGTLCAFAAILPALHARGGSFPFPMIAILLGAVLLAGLASSLLAVIAALRSPLLPALRSE